MDKMTFTAYDLHASIQKGENIIKEAKERYLLDHGWELTCNTPGAHWMWFRDFSDIDKERMEWWEKSNGLSEPSKPIPMGRVMATLDLAISMTESVLCDNEDLV